MVISTIPSVVYQKKKKTKVGSPFSAYLDIIYGVPQGSTLGPLFFNTDL